MNWVAKEFATAAASAGSVLTAVMSMMSVLSFGLAVTMPRSDPALRGDPRSFFTISATVSTLISWEPVCRSRWGSRRSKT